MMGWIAAAVIAILGAFGIFVALRARGVASAESDALRNEMQSLLAAQSQATAAQISQLAQSLTAQLGQVSQQVQSGMASVGTIATSAQKAVSEQLQANKSKTCSGARKHAARWANWLWIAFSRIRCLAPATTLNSDFRPEKSWTRWCA